MHVIATSGRGTGTTFTLLGVTFDTGLTMEQEISELVNAVSWKIAAILKPRRFFSTAELINMYKSKSMSFLEYRTAGIYHACSTHLDRLYSCQRRFVHELGLSEEQGLLDYNLAPLTSRRDLAMLGVIHRTVLGHGPPHFGVFFKLDKTLPRRTTRDTLWRHNKQLEDIRQGNFLELERRSALGLIAVYNLLPQSAVDENSVQAFQPHLQGFLKQQAKAQVQSWQTLFSPRQPMYNHPVRGFRYM